LDHSTITVRDLQSIAGRAGLTAPYRYMATMLASADGIRPISSGTKADLALTMFDRDGATDCHFVYRPGVLSRAEVTDITAAFARVLVSLTGDGAEPGMLAHAAEVAAHAGRKRCAPPG